MNILLLIIILFTRLYSLDIHPAGLNMDEVGMGYNAYSIFKTAHDEWGNFLPLAFRSVGDFKSPTPIYLMVPLIALFGLTEIAVRLPAAIFSCLSLFLLFFLSRNYIFKKDFSLLSWLVVLLATLSPWYLFYSRLGYEAVIMIFFVLANILFFYRFASKPSFFNQWGIYLSALLAVITYNPAKVFIPLLDLVILIKLFPQVKLFFNKKRSFLILTLLSQIILIIPVIYYYFFGPGGQRVNMVFLSNDFEYFKILSPSASQNILGWFGSLFIFILFWFRRYLEYFTPQFFLSTGLPLVMPNQPTIGLIYFLEFCLFIFGLICLFIKRFTNKFFISPSLTTFILLFWFMLSFLPASLANNSQHSLRSLIAFPVVYLIIGFGLASLFSLIRYKFLVGIIIFAFYSLNLIRFADYYLVHYPYQMAEYKQFGWKQMALYALFNREKYNAIYIDPRYGTQGPYTVGVPHLFFLFYSQYDPYAYQNSEEVRAGRSNFYNFNFEYIDWNTYDHSQNNLYIASPWSIPLNQIKPEQIKYQINFPNGQIALMAVADKP